MWQQVTQARIRKSCGSRLWNWYGDRTSAFISKKVLDLTHLKRCSRKYSCQKCWDWQHSWFCWKFEQIVTRERNCIDLLVSGAAHLLANLASLNSGLAFWVKSRHPSVFLAFIEVAAIDDGGSIPKRQYGEDIILMLQSVTLLVRQRWTFELGGR